MAHPGHLPAHQRSGPRGAPCSTVTVLVSQRSTGAESSTVIGNLIDAGIGLPAGVLEGVKGTIPGALSDRQMKSALLAVNPNVIDFSYGPSPMTPSL